MNELDSAAPSALSLIHIFEDDAFRLVCHLRCLEHHEGTSLKCREHGLAVARRYTPLRLAPVVEGGDLRGGHPPARQSFVQKPNRRAVFVRRQYFEAAQSVPAPGPVADRLEAARRLVVGISAPTRQSGLCLLYTSRCV